MVISITRIVYLADAIENIKNAIHVIQENKVRRKNLRSTKHTLRIHLSQKIV